MARRRTTTQNVDRVTVHAKLVASMKKARHTGKWQPLLTALLEVPPGANRRLITKWIERFSPFWVPIHLPAHCMRFVRNPEGAFDVAAATAHPFWTLDSPELRLESRPNRKHRIRLVSGGLPSLGKRS